MVFPQEETQEETHDTPLNSSLQLEWDGWTGGWWQRAGDSIFLGSHTVYFLGGERTMHYQSLEFEIPVQTRPFWRGIIMLSYRVDDVFTSGVFTDLTDKNLLSLF